MIPANSAAAVVVVAVAAAVVVAAAVAAAAVVGVTGAVTVVCTVVCAAAGVAPEFHIELHSCSNLSQGLSQDQLERIAGQTHALELQMNRQLIRVRHVQKKFNNNLPGNQL